MLFSHSVSQQANSSIAALTICHFMSQQANYSVSTTEFTGASIMIVIMAVLMSISNGDTERTGLKPFSVRSVYCLTSLSKFL